MSNSISFTGYLTKDSEIKQVGTNTLLEFSVGNNVGYKDKQHTNWFKCTLWGNSGQALSKHLVKGKQVAVHGELSNKEFTTKEGHLKNTAEVRVHNVDLIGSKNTSESLDTVTEPQKTDMPF